MSKLLSKAISAIDKHGALLVYPIKNKTEPASLWSVLFPRSKMVWAWDEDSDNKVGQLWHLREELSRSDEVIYLKWYQGRATFFSKDVFVALVAYINNGDFNSRSFASNARNILEVLQADSPISTKQIKAAVELQGRSFEGLYNKAMKELWSRLFIVGYGEVEDSSFPSLSVGASELVFEDLWRQAKKMSPEVAQKYLEKKLGDSNVFYKLAKKFCATYSLGSDS
jgi:hypothetical protein